MSSVSSSYSNSSVSNSYGSNDKSEKNKKAACIRNRTNFSKVSSFHLIDKKDFNPKLLNMYIDNDASPKLKLLLKQIKRLDENDMKSSGKLYKHIIFTDVDKSTYGAKIIASALSAQGYNMVVHPQGKGFALDNNVKLLETKSNNFAMLMSKTFFDRPMNMTIRKNILERINSRPDNIHGDLIRFIILDQGFKEGIDLFDVKYVHLFEPLTVNADQKQAIGRGTRFCGQKGLEFHPKYGWPLFVYKYNVSIPSKKKSEYMQSKDLFEYYLKNSNIDMKKIIFANELENATINAAVDYNLNKSIHSFAIEDPPPIFPKEEEKENSYISAGGAIKSNVPKKIMNLKESRDFITKYYNRLRYPRITLENNCLSGGAMNGNIVNFTPTQDFVRKYFQPSSAYKGMLLHHSVGTGKTCTAIATATTSFDLEGYTILWVTRHTLKNDIWKNMFSQVCNIDIQNKIKKEGMVLPNKISGPMKYVSKNWMEPISYKQFTNLLKKGNKLYGEIVKRNGVEDPLKKTLLVIDEAHKLYSSQVAKSERPDTDILEKWIHNSYQNSGDDSVRVLLMTATPFTEDGMEMIKLLNLLRRKDKEIPTKFHDFAEKYLDTNGYFTKKGLKVFQDNVSGYISYLNRSQDARNFSHPVIEDLYAPLSEEKDEPKTDNKFIAEKKEKSQLMKEERVTKKRIKAELKDEAANKKFLVSECISDTKNKYEANIETEKENKIDRDEECRKIKSAKDKKECLKDSQIRYKQMVVNYKAKKDDDIKDCKKMVVGNDDVAEILKDTDDKINKYKEDIKKIVESKKERKEEIDELKLNIRKKQIENNGMKEEFKDNKKKTAEELRELKKIKDVTERKKAIKEYYKSNPLFSRNKELKSLLLSAKAYISNNKNLVNLMKIDDGNRKLKKISLDYNIRYGCK